MSRLVAALALTTGCVGCGTHLYLNSLERRYPALPPETTTTKILRIPDSPETQRCAYVDVFAARIPLQKLLHSSAEGESNADLALIWARHFLESRIMQMERKSFGLPSLAAEDSSALSTTFREAKEGDWHPGEVRVVKSRTTDGNLFLQAKPHVEGVLFCWKLPDKPRIFFENLAVWGYPWRLMSGGRHELNVHLLDTTDDEEAIVEVRFASAHDYRIVPSEGDHQKTIPNWTMRLHRGFGRFVLDRAVKELQ